MTRARPLLLFMTLVAASVLAGCTSPDGTGSLEDPWSGAPELEWGILDANTTAFEPWEAQGAIFVGWSRDAFAIHAENEADLPAYLVRTQDTVYTSYTQMGWVAIPVAEALGPEPSVSNRAILWDLRALLGAAELDHGTKQVDEHTVHTAKGALVYGGRPLVVEAQVTVQEGRIVEARVDSPQGREAPFSFLAVTPDMTVPAFPDEAPAEDMVLDQATVDEKDPVAQKYHARLIGLLRAYARNHGGLLPAEVTPDELRAELLVEGGGEWPKGAYDGKAVEDRSQSGHFGWARCSDTDGRYTGYGWDGLLIEQAFGRGCR